jgi:hypothetical protein
MRQGCSLGILAAFFLAPLQGVYITAGMFMMVCPTSLENRIFFGRYRSSSKDC